MDRKEQWKKFWEQKAQEEVSDFEYDHGRNPRKSEIEALSNEELVAFINPQSEQVLVDAGCGTGANIDLLHNRVRKIIALDYNQGAVERCKQRLAHNKISNVEVFQGSVTKLPAPDASVDTVICMSVFQYLSDGDVRDALCEFKRVLTPTGSVVLHVKNLTSLYLSTLVAAKKVKSLFQSSPRLEFFRPYSWYISELAACGYEVTHYNSFNLFMIDRMPTWLLSRLQAFEFRHRHNAFFSNAFIRRSGSDLKLKARLTAVQVERLIPVTKPA
jgi:ubiquinone/menaquinone biosynthesis C-methylase UbiE